VGPGGVRGGERDWVWTLFSIYHGSQSCIKMVPSNFWQRCHKGGIFIHCNIWLLDTGAKSRSHKVVKKLWACPASPSRSHTIRSFGNNPFWLSTA
jgi:hypothetical protein